MYGGPVGYTAATGHHLSGAFLIAWRALGGRAVFGDPLSDVLLDARGRWVQVTENALLALPAAAVPAMLTSAAAVAIEPLGVEMTASRHDETPFQPVPMPPASAALWFPETGHTLAYGFLAHWQATDGATTLGPPLSEEFEEDGRVVQWFARGRLDYDAARNIIWRAPLGRMAPSALALVQPPVEPVTGAVPLDSLPPLPSPARLSIAAALGFGLPPDQAVAVLAPVGKGQPLPLHAAPSDLVPAAELGLSTGLTTVRRLLASDLLALVADAERVGLRLRVVSGHRSALYQAEVVEREVRLLRSAGLSDEEARREAARYVARPGESEHHLGTVIDFNEVDGDFASAPEARFLAEHGWRYGFLVSYPPGAEARTGYVHEPWHLRWVGRPLAAA
ncbi:MAG: M15 family metallopeptidase, partial [Chloroflexi bacterium]|nr:M15 family metallopeptidase [Chloroflexota bacterium]